MSTDHLSDCGCAGCVNAAIAASVEGVHRVRFYVDVEIPRAAYIDHYEVLLAIKERIVEQIAGHRTSRRLADKCTVSLWED